MSIILMVSIFLERCRVIPVKTEFHQIPSIDEIPWNFPWNSMEFHQPQFHKIQWNWNSMENLIEFHGIPCSMEFRGFFHGIIHGIPWKKNEKIR
jgi:hypothetical protein